MERLARPFSLSSWLALTSLDICSTFGNSPTGRPHPNSLHPPPKASRCSHSLNSFSFNNFHFCCSPPKCSMAVAFSNDAYSRHWRIGLQLLSSWIGDHRTHPPSTSLWCGGVSSRSPHYFFSFYSSSLPTSRGRRARRCRVTFDVWHICHVSIQCMCVLTFNPRCGR